MKCFSDYEIITRLEYKIKKHTKQIVSGLILFVLGAMTVPVIFVVILFVCLLNDKPLAKFTIPGQAIVTIEKHGRYYLWNDYQTIFEGQTYSSPEELPGGLDISLLENEDGNPVEFVSNQSITSSNVTHIRTLSDILKLMNPESIS